MPIASHPARQPPVSIASDPIIGSTTRPVICPTEAIAFANDRRAMNQLLTAP